MRRGVKIFLRIVIITACGLLAMLAWLRPISVSLERGMPGVLLDRRHARAVGHYPEIVLADSPGSNKSTISYPLRGKSDIDIERRDYRSWVHNNHQHSLDGRVRQKAGEAYIDEHSSQQPGQQQQQQQKQKRPRLPQGKPRQNWSTRPAALVRFSDSDASSNRVPLPDRIAKIENLVFSEFVRIRDSPPQGGESISAQQAAEAVNSYAELLKLRPPHERNSSGILYSGKGIVFSSPPSERNLLMVAHSISHLRTELGCSLPVEVFVGSWAQQLYPGWKVPEGPEWELQREVFALPGVQLRVVETDLHEYLDADNRFMWKVMAVMLSSFDEVLFLDEDNLPLRDPSTLFDDMHYFGITGLFWSDIWAMVQTAPFYRFLKGGIPLTSLGLSQEAGQVMVHKSAGGMEALLLVAYINYWPDFLYRHIYCVPPDLPEEGCHPTKLQHGVGDKDTFMIAWHVMEQPYEFMPPPALFALDIGDAMRPSQHRTCAVAQLQLGRDRQPQFMHHNLRKAAQQDVRPGARDHAARLANMLVPDVLLPNPERSRGAVKRFMCQRVEDEDYSSQERHNRDVVLRRSPVMRQMCIAYRRSIEAPCKEMFSVDFIGSITRGVERLLERRWAGDNVPRMP